MESIILKRSDVPISQLITFQTAGTVGTVIDFDDVDELSDFIQCETGDTYFILGRGSNSLIDPNIHRTIVRIANDAVAPEHNGTKLRLCAGMTMNRLQDYAATAGLSGFEFSAGVPASLGGMVAMNFGCWGRSMSDFVTAIEIVDDRGDRRWITNAEAEFSYRRSIFHRKRWIVVAAEMQMTLEDPEIIRKTVRSTIQSRVQKQPLRDKTFGSIFKNPPGHFSAQLLEAAGLKGKSWNQIQLSPSHANFLINKGDATFDETLQVLQLLQDTVKSTASIDLEMEVQIFR